MSDKTVAELATITRQPVERLLANLRSAGVQVSGPQDPVSEQDRARLLNFMRGEDGGAGGQPKITLKRTSHSALKVSTGAGSTRTVNVEVRKKRTYVSKSVTEPAVSPAVVPVAEPTASELHEQGPAPAVEQAEVMLGADAATLPAEPQVVLADEPPAGGADAVANEPSDVQEPVPEPVQGIAVDTVDGDSAPPTLTPVVAGEPVPVVEVVPAAIEVATGVPEAAAEAGDASALTTEAAEVPIAAPAAAPKLGFIARAPKRIPPKPAPEPGARPAEAVKAKPEPVKPEAKAGANDGGGKAKARKAGTRIAPGGPAIEEIEEDSGVKIARDKLQHLPMSRGPGGGGRRRRDRGGARQVEPTGRHQFERPTEPVKREVVVPASITVADLAQRLAVKGVEVVKKLMQMGVMATINQSIDQDTAMLLVDDFGHAAVAEQPEDLEQRLVSEDQYGPSLPRPPVVTIMGHVDHGKTSLLDYIRKTRVAAGEAGGITQHIGAYHVVTGKGVITFLDTPGHAAFSAMRARGAQVTDIVVLVVAADDGVMPQTKEAVQHARAAGVPIVVAVNKIDKPGADIDRVRAELSQIGIIAEDWGGEQQFAFVSAKTGQGIDDLLDAILLQAEVMEFKAPVEGPAAGVVIESSLDKGRGPVATVLITRGTLNRGDVVLAGGEHGRVRALLDEVGRQVKQIGPSMPAQILGLSDTPAAGDEFLVVADERLARELSEQRQALKRDTHLAAQQAVRLDDIFSQMKEGERLSLSILLKTDVQGSFEALRDALIKLSTEEVSVKIIGGGVGAISESDLNLAVASKAVVIGFNVRADATARKLVQNQGIDLRYYSIIYEAIDDVKKAMSGLLSPEMKEQITGLAEVRQVFRSPKFGAVAGCMVMEGMIKRGNPIRVLRDSVVIYEGELESLRRFKDDINEVRQGFECGIAVKNYNDVREGDLIEVFERVEVARTL